MMNTEAQVKLRAIEPEDLDMLYRIENDSELWNVSETNVPYSRFALHDYVANSSYDIYKDRQVRMMIDDMQGNTVGIVDIVNFNPQHRRAEVGIIIQNCYRNKGYAQSAVRKVLDYSRTVLHLHQLYAVVDEQNDISIRLFESLGFVRNVRMKDWLSDDDAFHDAWLMQFFL